MNRPHSVSGMFVATLVLWLVSIGCGIAAGITFDPGADPVQPLVVVGAVAAVASAIFALWTGWRACRALDYLVASVR